MKKITLNVRQFAVPAPRVGSIDSHSGYGPLPTSGQEAHVIIQKQRVKENPLYVPEKKLEYTFSKKKYDFVVSGRADGYIEKTGFIEEIKSAFALEDLAYKLNNDFNHPYIWQLRTYGYIHYKKTGQTPTLRLHLVSLRNFKSEDIDIELDPEAYESWLEVRLEELVLETKEKEKVFKRRLQASEAMTFPFLNPRKGQKELVQTIATCLNEETPLLAQAPTGLGKTMGVLYPALQEALPRGQKVVYVTPKNTQHQVAEEAIEKLQEGGSDVRALTITAKSKMCLKPEPLCNPQFCEYAKDYYQKVAEHQLVNKLGKKNHLSAELLKNWAEKYQVCPFELSLEAIERADVVIGDYNYVFAPRSLIARLAEPLLEQKEKANLVVDEAHNLPARAQDYFSPTLSTYQLDLLEKEFPRLPTSFALRVPSITNRARKLIQSYGPDGISKKIDIDLDPFLDLEKEIRELTTEYLESDVEVLTQDPILRLMNLWSDFVGALTLAGEEFFQTYQKNRSTELIKITCCDASNHLGLAYKEFKNVVAFSATLKPFEYYQELMGFPASSRKMEFESPFLKENRKLLIIPQISTKYSDRWANSEKIATAIQKITELKKGNYLALFPSFEFLTMVANKLQSLSCRILTQDRDMKGLKTKEYLEILKAKDQPTLLLAVQGGVFSEGVDFPGDMLIGAFVVGPALPTFDFERDLIRKYYEKRYGKEKAFNYTYIYPAMAKAIQSAGRVIRTEEDRGLIVMLDSRFLQEAYSETMPEGWFEHSPQELVSQKILQDVQNFWDQSP